MSESSRNADPRTPEFWKFVNLRVLPEESVPPVELFGLSVGVFDSYVGYQTCQACGIERAWHLTLEQAIANGSKLDAWLQMQERKIK